MISRPGFEFDRPTESEIARAREYLAHGYSREAVFGRARPFYLLQADTIRLLGHWMGTPHLQIDFVEELDGSGKVVRKLNAHPVVLRARNLAEADNLGLELIRAYQNSTSFGQG